MQGQVQSRGYGIPSSKVKQVEVTADSCSEEDDFDDTLDGKATLAKAYLFCVIYSYEICVRKCQQSLG